SGPDRRGPGPGASADPAGHGPGGVRPRRRHHRDDAPRSPGGPMSDEEQVSFSKIGDAKLIRLSGEIDLANAPEIGQQIVAHMTEAGAVLIDLTAVSFLDSAGVRLLDALVGDLDDHGTAIRLVVGE